MIDRTEYQAWQAFAARCTRRSADADDLLQEALLTAVAMGRTDLECPRDRAWLRGVIRKKAAMVARSAARRTRHESRAAGLQPSAGPGVADEAPVLPLSELPRAARVVATLILHGMARREIQHILGIGDAAFRQRLTSIRRGLAARLASGAELSGRRLVPRLDVGLLRQALLAAVRRQGVLATHDPDGHLILIGSPVAHKPTASGNRRMKPTKESRNAN